MGARARGAEEEAFTVSKTPDSAWFAPSSQEAAVLSVLLNNNPPTFKVDYSHALLYVSRPLILLLAILFPKDTSQALKCFFAGLKRSVRFTEVVVQNRTMPGRRLFKRMSGSQLIPGIQTPVMKLWKRFSSKV